MAIALRSRSDIEKLRRASKIAREVLERVAEAVRPGVTTRELDALAEAECRKLGAIPSFKGLYGFPASLCTSVDEIIIHGIPNDQPLREGEIVGLDFGTNVDGWYGDCAITVGVGSVSQEDQALMRASEETLAYAIEIIHENMRFKELTANIENFIKARGYVPLRNYCGHGIGRKPHEEPSIPNYLEGKPNQGPKIKNGMVFCLEPMICQRNGDAKVLDDGWSVRTGDGLKGSHHEHTVAIIDGKAEILSLI
ncbi:MAG: type I methionyl aminopeptidase [Campylobacterales bacterium]